MLFVLNFLATTNVFQLCAAVQHCPAQIPVLVATLFLPSKLLPRRILQDCAGRCKKLILNFTPISRASNAVCQSEDSPAHNIPFVIDSSLLYEVLCRLKSEACLAGLVSFVVNFSSSSHHRVEAAVMSRTISFIMFPSLA